MVEEAPQVLGEVVHRGIAVARIVGDALVDDGREVGFRAGEGRNGCRADAPEEPRRGAFREDGVPGDEFVERRAEGVLVTEEGADAVDEPFGGHVAERAVLGTGAVDRVAAVLQRAGEAEVGDVDHAVSVEQQVRRLDVAVHHLVGVRIGEGTGRLETYVGEDAEVVGEGVPVEPFAVDKLHRVVAGAGALPCRDDLHDAGMPQRGDEARLALELRAPRRVRDEGGGEQLHGDTAVEGELAGLEDDAHAAAADLPQQAEVGTGQLGQFRGGCNGASARRVADRLQVVEKGQRLQQFGGVFGVFGREDGDVRRVAEVAAVEVEVDKLLEGLPTDAHGWNSVYSTSFALRRWSART